MSHRTTFALDSATAQRLKRLAARWRVSQAEVVRRSLERAERLEEEARPDPIELLERLHANNRGLEAATADAYLDEVYEDRHRWRDE